MQDKTQEYDAITIDTCIFHKYHFRFYYGLLKTLRQFGKGKNRLVISDIVIGEIKSQLSAQLREAKDKVLVGTKTLKKFLVPWQHELKKIDVVLNELDSPDQIANQIVNEFINLCAVEIIKSSEHLNVDELLTKYFSMSPPFSINEQKKYEFPDAIALLSLDNWGTTNKFNVLAVSTDKDWINFINKSTSLKHIDDLSKALGILRPTIFNEDIAIDFIKIALLNDKSELHNELDKLLSDSIDNTSINIEADSDFQYEYEIEYSCLISFEPMLDQNGEPMMIIIDAEDNNITIECRIKYKFEINCQFDFFVHDSIDKDDFCIGSSNENREFDFESEVIIIGSIYKEETNSIFEIISIDISRYIEDLDFGYVRPNLGDAD